MSPDEEFERLKTARQRKQIEINVSDCRYRLEKLDLETLDHRLRLAEIDRERERLGENIAASEAALIDMDGQIPAAGTKE